jgi:hypothetical protein
MMGSGGIFLGQELLNIIESNSNNASPSGAGGKTDSKSEKVVPTVNNIIINNYNGSVLKNITNLEPYA